MTCRLELSFFFLLHAPHTHTRKERVTQIIREGAAFTLKTQREGSGGRQIKRGRAGNGPETHRDCGRQS